MITKQELEDVIKTSSSLERKYIAMNVHLDATRDIARLNNLIDNQMDIINSMQVHIQDLVINCRKLLTDIEEGSNINVMLRDKSKF